MKKKSINGENFGWDKMAYEGRGHWFTLVNGKFGRPANVEETDMLEKSNVTNSGDYVAAQRIKNKRVRDLIAENIIDGHSIIGATKKSISDKVKGRVTRIKENFDPLNIASALLGRTKLGTSLAGAVLGRSSADAEYFASKGKKGGKSGKKKDPWHSTIGAGKITPVQRDDSVSDVFAKIYNLLKGSTDELTKQREIERDFQKVREEQESERFEKLISAIMGRVPAAAVETPIESKKDPTLLDKFKQMFKSIVDGLGKFVKAFIEGTFLKGIKSLIGTAFSGLFSKIFGWLPKMVLRGLGTLLLNPVVLAGIASALAAWKLSQEIPKEISNMKQEDTALKASTESGDMAGIIQHAKQAGKGLHGIGPMAIGNQDEKDNTKKLVKEAIEKMPNSPVKEKELEYIRLEPKVQKTKEQILKFKPDNFGSDDAYLARLGFTPKEIELVDSAGTNNYLFDQDLGPVYQKLNDMLQLVRRTSAEVNHTPYMGGKVTQMPLLDSPKILPKMENSASMPMPTIMKPIVNKTVNNQSATRDDDAIGSFPASTRNSDDTIDRTISNYLRTVQL